jgi:hypothetical protein
MSTESDPTPSNGGYDTLLGDGGRGGLSNGPRPPDARDVACVLSGVGQAVCYRRLRADEQAIVRIGLAAGLPTTRWCMPGA